MSRPRPPTALTRLLLGPTPQRRRHVALMFMLLAPYAGSTISILHGRHLGLMPPGLATALLGISLSTFLGFFLLVRSGWSERFEDPLLTLPHATCSVLITLGAYASLGDHRGNAAILMAQVIMLSMFRLKPRQVLMLGVSTVVMLGACILAITLKDPVLYKPSTGWTHFILAGSTLLLLALIGKWVSDIRVRITRQSRELTEAIDTLQQMATTDMLTGTLNRRMLTELLEGEFKLWERTGQRFCVALFDVDHFKQVNDRHGHAVGDLVLKRFVERSRPQLRQVDKLGRWGGEEFLLLLPHASLDAALVAADRIRESFEALRFDEAPGLRVSVSGGVAEVRPGEVLEHTIDRADAALYSAKQAGRNRCMDADERSTASLPTGANA
jgi:diguanylate cyclase (GGDEF)-like protein